MVAILLQVVARWLLCKCFLLEHQPCCRFLAEADSCGFIYKKYFYSWRLNSDRKLKLLPFLRLLDETEDFCWSFHADLFPYDAMNTKPKVSKGNSLQKCENKRAVGPSIWIVSCCPVEVWCEMCRSLQSKHQHLHLHWNVPVSSDKQEDQRLWFFISSKNFTCMIPASVWVVFVRSVCLTKMKLETTRKLWTKFHVGLTETIKQCRRWLLGSSYGIPGDWQGVARWLLWHASWFLDCC